MKQILIVALLIILISGIASAEQITEWSFGERNDIPYGMQGIRYDFEEGSNCAEFDNQYPDVATFLTVLGTRPYGSDEPSYSKIGGKSCGGTRCIMHIYPWCGYYLNGTPYPWVYTVTGNVAFNSITGPDIMGGYWPGTKARIEVKEDTTYVSFLVSTGGNFYVTLYDTKGNVIHREKIAENIHRIGTEPSNQTLFYYYSHDKDIMSIRFSGSFNGWHVDDLIIAGEPGYIEDDYSWAAERMKRLVGAPFNPIGLGYNLFQSQFFTADEIINNNLPNWDPLNKEIVSEPGIMDTAGMIWAYNQDENIINNLGIDDMANKDFTEWVAYGDQQPGDVAFIDYEADGFYDEVVMFIEPQIDPETGATEDCVRFLEEDGVHYFDSEYLHNLYGIDNGIGVQSFMDVKSLPDSPKGNKSPYPKVPGKYKKSV